jgi:hypothetical protein
MPGPVPGIHVFAPAMTKDVDGRDKPGHDGKQAIFRRSKQALEGRRLLLSYRPSAPQ